MNGGDNRSYDALDVGVEKLSLIGPPTALFISCTMLSISSSDTTGQPSSSYVVAFVGVTELLAGKSLVEFVARAVVVFEGGIDEVEEVGESDDEWQLSQVPMLSRSLLEMLS
jgi:hypothetical protein